MPTLNHGEKLQASRSDGQRVDVAEFASDNFLEIGKQDEHSNGTRFGADSGGNGGVLTQEGVAYIYALKLPAPVDGKFRIKGSDGKVYEFAVTEVV
jgi:hypothetical protein